MEREPDTEEMERPGTIITLFGVLLIVAALVSISMFLYGNIPLLGSLPGDRVFLLPSGELFLPFTSCIAVSAILTGIAALVTATSKKQ